MGKEGFIQMTQIIRKYTGCFFAAVLVVALIVPTNAFADTQETSGADIDIAAVGTRSGPFIVSPGHRTVWDGLHVLDITGGSMSNSAQLIVWPNNGVQGSSNQRFYFEEVGTDYRGEKFYKIRNVKTGKVLDISGGVAYNGAPIIQFTDHGGKNQLWYFRGSLTSYFQIVSALDDHYCMDIEGSGKANGTRVILWTNNKANNQKFHRAITF
ncbi:MAG: RICIN domain-containing protein [Coriobacteriales bacterium]|jgi:hypothetical protein|nr:RICIN domain-containing protein [Coriobacteriales bacterium]